MLKTVSKDVVKFIPTVERGLEKPTTVCFKRMSKAQHDTYTNSLTEVVNTPKGQKVVSKFGEASRRLFETCLAADESGVFIYNAEFDGKVFEKMGDKKEAVEFVLPIREIRDGPDGWTFRGPQCE